MNAEMNNDKSNALFRALALGAVVVVGAGSLGWMFYTGRNNPSILLMTLFTGWVGSPFLALILMEVIALRRSSVRYKMMLAIAFISVIGYSGLVTPPDVKPAFIFLAVPLLSWIIMIIVVVASTISRKNKGQ